MQSNLVQVVSESSEISPYIRAQHDDKILFYFTMKAEKEKKNISQQQNIYMKLFTLL